MTAASPCTRSQRRPTRTRSRPTVGPRCPRKRNGAIALVASSALSVRIRRRSCPPTGSCSSFASFAACSRARLVMAIPRHGTPSGRLPLLDRLDPRPSFRCRRPPSKRAARARRLSRSTVGAATDASGVRSGDAVAVKVLVVYASRHGTTAAIAARIADRLVEAGAIVELQSVDQVKALDDFEAVVFGAPVYDQSWPPEANGFLWAARSPGRSTTLAVQRRVVRRHETGDRPCDPQRAQGHRADPCRTAAARIPRLQGCDPETPMAVLVARVLPCARWALRRPPRLADDRCLGRADHDRIIPCPLAPEVVGRRHDPAVCRLARPARRLTERAVPAEPAPTPRARARRNDQ